MPKMGIGDFFIFFYFWQTTFERTSAGTKALITPPTPPTHHHFTPCPLLTLFASFNEWTTLQIRADLCENILVCLVYWKDRIELQLMKSLRGRCHLTYFGPNTHIFLHVWSLFYFYKWKGTHNRGKFNKKHEENWCYKIGSSSVRMQCNQGF